MLVVYGALAERVLKSSPVAGVVWDDDQDRRGEVGGVLVFDDLQSVFGESEVFLVNHHYFGD